MLDGARAGCAGPDARNRAGRRLNPIVFPRVTRAHARELAREERAARHMAELVRAAQGAGQRWLAASKHALEEQRRADAGVFANRVPMDDAWHVMAHYVGTAASGKFVYHAGDVVEVLGPDLRWHRCIVAYSPTFEGKRSGERASGDERDDDDDDDEGDEDGTAEQKVAVLAEAVSSLASLLGDKGKSIDARCKDALAALDREKAYAQRDQISVIRPDEQIQRGIDASEVRVLSQAVMALFGQAPMLWQQYTLLKAEQKMRFARNDPEDFMEVDWEDWARDEFNKWLEDERNETFRRYYESFSMDPGAQAALLKFVLAPFEMMDQVKEWDLEDGTISIYSYLSVLGSGYLIAVVAVVQWSIPILLFTEMQNNCAALFHPMTSIPPFHCPGDGMWANRLLLVGILIIYLFNVVPNQLEGIAGKIGVAKTDTSKLDRLRTAVAEKGVDTWAMRFGLFFDSFMNTSFVCLLYMLNIVMIYFAESKFDVSAVCHPPPPAHSSSRPRPHTDAAS